MNKTVQTIWYLVLVAYTGYCVWNICDNGPWLPIIAGGIAVALLHKAAGPWEGDKNSGE